MSQSDLLKEAGLGLDVLGRVVSPVVSPEKEKAIMALNAFLDSLPPEQRHNTNRYDFFMAGYNFRNKEIEELTALAHKHNGSSHLE